MKATGIVQTMAVAEDDPEVTRHRIGPGLAGAIHQHFLTFRLDMAVDGDANTVYEVDAVPLPRGTENPHGNAFTSRAREIADESESGREVNAASARHWRIANDGARNGLGEAPGVRADSGRDGGDDGGRGVVGGAAGGVRAEAAVGDGA